MTSDFSDVRIPHHDVFVAGCHDLSSLQTVVSRVRSNWKSSELKWKSFSGTSNTLVGCFIGEGWKETWNDIVLIRLYGKNSEYFVDHDLECKYMMLLWKHGLSSQVLSTFQNGYCHGYVDGRVLSVPDLSDEKMSRKCATLMARLHSVPSQNESRGCLLFRKTRAYIDKIQDSFDGNHDRLHETIPSLDVFVKEVDFLENLIYKSSTYKDLVLCHNDISSANLIFNEKQEALHLIDFEFCFPNYPAFDVGNFFNEFAGVDGSRYDLYPDEAFQKWWIKFYLDERNRLKGVRGHICPDEINDFCEQTGHFALMSHLFWVSWAVLQANVSELDNDYIGYASKRMSEYYRRKEILGL